MFWATLYWKFKKLFVKRCEKITEEKAVLPVNGTLHVKKSGTSPTLGLSVRATHFLGGSGKVLGIGKGRNLAIVKNEVNR